MIRGRHTYPQSLLILYWGRTCRVSEYFIRLYTCLLIWYYSHYWRCPLHARFRVSSFSISYLFLVVQTDPQSFQRCPLFILIPLVSILSVPESLSWTIWKMRIISWNMCYLELFIDIFTTYLLISSIKKCSEGRKDGEGWCRRVCERRWGSPWR